MELQWCWTIGKCKLRGPVVVLHRAGRGIVVSLNRGSMYKSYSGSHSSSSLSSASSSVPNNTPLASSN